MLIYVQSKQAPLTQCFSATSKKNNGKPNSNSNSNQQTMASPIKIQIPIQRKQWQVQCQFKQIIQ